MKLIKFIFYFFRKLHQISKTNKVYRRMYAYYAFPALVSLLITFALIRTFALLFPASGLIVSGVHVHHFTAGIFILLIVGYLALWIDSWRLKYNLALAYGVGTGFILDEFYVWLRLDASPITHAQYSAIVIGATLLLIIILLPSGVNALHKLFKTNQDKKINQ